MKNPFPGMNPYLETDWHGVSLTLLVYIADAIGVQRPDGLVVHIRGETVDDVFEHSMAGLPCPVSPEVATKPVYVYEDSYPPRHIEITDYSDNVVTAIEVLSRRDKSSTRGRMEYMARQDAYRKAGVNVVEIDLLRGGDYLVRAPLEDIPQSRRGPYFVCVYRASKSRWEVYPASLRERLPSVRIPLRPTDADIVLPLQKLIDEVCERGRYGQPDDCRRLDPPLAAEDAAWSESLLRDTGLRTA